MSMGLVHVENGEYVLDQKLVSEFEIDEIRTENLISVYANEIAPLSDVIKIIEQAMVQVDKVDGTAVILSSYLPVIRNAV